MRVLITLLLTAAAFCMFSFTAHAAVLVDHCADLSLSYAQYSNLIPVTGSGPGALWQSPPDTNCLQISPPSLHASVIYTIQGAETISVALYSRMSTFATQRSDGNYTIGFSDVTMLDQQKHRTYYCPDDGEVYLHLGGQPKSLYRDSLGRFMFRDGTCLQNHSEFMGLNVYTSVDGVHFVPLQDPPVVQEVNPALSITKVVQDDYERYAVRLPPNAKYVKVTLRDFTALDTAQRDGVPQPSPSRLHLAQVSFSGTNMLVGPQPATSTPESSSSEQTTGGGQSSSTPERERPKSSRSSSSSSSSSSKSSSSTSFKAAASSSGKGSSKTLTETLSSSAPPESSTSFEEQALPVMATVQVETPIQEKKSGWKTATMAVVYTISAVGILGRLLYKLF